MPSWEYENVYSILDYYDGIRTGIADFHGAPHYYERPFDDALNDWADYFLLSPINEETFKLAMEDWAIWQRWYLACQPQKTTRETHPALPEDRARHDQIKMILDGRLVVDRDKALKATAELLASYGDINPKHVLHPFAKLQIKWSLVS